MLKHKGTYEIIAPEDIGYERSNEAGIVLGKLRYCCVSLWKFFICISHSSCISTSLVPTKRDNFVMPTKFCYHSETMVDFFLSSFVAA